MLSCSGRARYIYGTCYMLTIIKLATTDLEYVFIISKEWREEEKFHFVMLMSFISARYSIHGTKMLREQAAHA